MTYAISDIHGCYEKYLAMLQKINFNGRDVLYVLGDAVDRGEQPIEVLRDMSLRANVFPIMGNHDYMALFILKRLTVEITEENYDSHIDQNLMEALILWLSDGGQTTLDEFSKLSREEKEDIIDYLEEFTPYEIVEANEHRYVLVHAGLPKTEDFDHCDFRAFIVAETDYGKKYFENAYLVTGHTPTFLINEKYRGKIYRENNHIAIDLGVVFGGALGCICLETGEEFTV
jgi:serine/threonine protein phosphatase 1